MVLFFAVCVTAVIVVIARAPLEEHYPDDDFDDDLFDGVYDDLDDDLENEFLELDKDEHVTEMALLREARDRGGVVETPTNNGTITRIGGFTREDLD